MSRRVVIGYYGFQTFFALYIWLPIFYAYQRQMGLDDAQIFGIQGYYYLAFVILEVPTGFFADRWGYRNTLQLGALLLFVSQLFAIFQPTYMGFLFHFLLLALARSLVSGAASAYLYEHLKLHGRQTDYKQLEGNARALGLIAKVIGWSGVGAMMAWHLSLPYWLTAGAALIALFVAISLPKLPTQATAQTDMPVAYGDRSWRFRHRKNRPGQSVSALAHQRRIRHCYPWRHHGGDDHRRGRRFRAFPMAAEVVR